MWRHRMWWLQLLTVMVVSSSFAPACGKLGSCHMGFFECTFSHVNDREMAVGNTFGATALSSFGGFWISFAIILTPGGFEIVTASGADFLNVFGFYLMVSVPGWQKILTVPN